MFTKACILEDERAVKQAVLKQYPVLKAAIGFEIWLRNHGGCQVQPSFCIKVFWVLCWGSQEMNCIFVLYKCCRGVISAWWYFYSTPCNCFLHAFLMHIFDVHMQVLKMLDEFNNREEDVSVSHRQELWMLMESVEEGCHFNGTPNYRDCE